MQDNIVTVKEFAKLLMVQQRAVYKWINKGMPAIKLGNFLRIDKDEALLWLKKREK